MTTAPIDVPPGLNGVAVADTTIGDVRGDEGFYHYRQYDATELARTCTFEDVWFLFAERRLPNPDELTSFRTNIADRRFVPDQLRPLMEAVAASHALPLAQLRSVLSASTDALGLRPLLDLDESGRRAQAMTVSAFVPAGWQVSTASPAGRRRWIPIRHSVTWPPTSTNRRGRFPSRPPYGRSSST